MDQHLDKLRLVAERYSELQGLRLAYAGVVWVTFGAALATQADVTSLELLAAIVGALALYLPGNWALRRFYSNRFGRTVVPASQSRRWLVPALVVMIVTSKLGGGQLAGAFVVVAVGSLWIAIRDWPARGYYVVGGIAGALATTAQFAALPGVGSHQALGCAIVGLGYIPIGLLDHRLLTSVMRTRREPGLLKQE